jgi:hypothetical protein
MATGRVPTTANSPLTAKGDLFGYSTTQARVAVGNDGETLVADSSTSTGLRWQGNYAAGKNKIINGDFGISQRGTSFSSVASGTYTLDRWLSAYDGTAGTYVISQQTFTLGTAPVTGYEGTYFARYAVTVAGVGNAVRGFDQRIEDVRQFANQTLTVSVWLKADSARTVGAQIYQNFGSGGSGEVYSTAQNFSVTTSWTRFTATFNVPSIAGKTIGASNYLALRFLTPTGVTSTIDFWGVQVEAGSVATAFQTATGTIQGELSACERYFQIVTGQMCSGSNTTTVYSGVNFRTQMRTAPSVALSAAMTITDAGADYTQSSASVSIVSSRANSTGAQISMPNFTSTTAHRPYSTTVTASQIQFSAEL